MTFRILSLVSALVAALPATLMANPYEDNLTMRLLPGWRTADGTHVAGLELTLAPGWKTYWRAPGEAGVPPVFDWAGSGNLAAARISWPRPEVFDLNGLRSIGYHDRVVLPLVLTPRDAGQPITLRGDVTLGICEEICVPLDLDLAGTLPAAAGRRDPAIAAALADRPYTAREARVGRVTCSVAPARNGMTLKVGIDMAATGGTETMVIETSDPLVWASDSRTRRDGGRLTGETELVHAAGQPFALDRSGLTITVLGRDRAVEIKGCTGG